MSEVKPEKVITDVQHERRYPGEGTYFAIFLLLAILTVTELITTYLPIVKIPLLLGLATAKAWLVVQFYMHLRYDSKILSWAFLAPVVVGVAATVLLQPLVTSVPFLR